MVTELEPDFWIARPEVGPSGGECDFGKVVELLTLKIRFWEVFSGFTGLGYGIMHVDR